MSGKSHVYGYDQSDASWHYCALSSNKELKVSDADTQAKLNQIVTNTASSGGDASATNQVTGNKGTIFFFDNNIIHRAGTSLINNREAILLQVYPSLNKIY